jgi:hypothetical protein
MNAIIGTVFIVAVILMLICIGVVVSIRVGDWREARRRRKGQP